MTEVDDDVRWGRCPSCDTLVYLKRLDRHAKVCPECSHHWRMSVRERLDLVLDKQSFAEFGEWMRAGDPLSFHDSKPYSRRLADAEEKTGEAEACVCGTATIDGADVVVAALEFGFMGGSIGGTTGEKIAMAARRAQESRTPLLMICASGGARMQEGLLSLMQLVKTSQEFARLHESGVACINLNTDPTYGGATASFATLGDIIIAEPGARMGFAGPNVIAQTIREALPDGFQTAEFMLDNGMIDMVVARDALRPMLGRLLRMHAAVPIAASTPQHSLITDPEQLPSRVAWDVVQAARDLGRPTTLDYYAAVFDDGFVELHGDRRSGDDRAVVGGLAQLDGRTVVVIGLQKGHSPSELVRRNFGMPNPAGYHKARRLMAYAGRFGFPVLTFVDTPGAFPGADAERRGQGTAIAECIMRMARLPVPTAVVVTGEGGSGGALALGVGNRVLMLENAYFSVISPEGCSSILWGTSTEAARAAEALKITSRELLTMGMVDGVIAEPPGGAPSDWETTARNVRSGLTQALGELAGMTAEQLTADRYARFARFGAHTEKNNEVPA